MKEANDCKNDTYISSCLIYITQEIMVTHLMILTTWITVKDELISAFGSEQTLSNQKIAFMSTHI